MHAPALAARAGRSESEAEAVAAARALADVARQPGGAAAMCDAGCVDELLNAVHGEHSGGLTQALVAAVSGQMRESAAAALDALVECAQRAPQCRGRIAGSGVLGLVSALLLSPRSGTGARALALRAVAALAADDDGVAAAGSAERRGEFEALRQQLVAAGSVGAAARAVGEPWDGESPLQSAGSEEDESDGGDDEAAVGQAALCEAACHAVGVLACDARAREQLKEHEAAQRCLRQLPSPHAAAALASLARSRAAGSALATEAAIGRILQVRWGRLRAHARGLSPHPLAGGAAVRASRVCAC